MPDYAIYTAFNAKDNTSKIFSEMSRGADKFGRSASGAFDGASRAGSKFMAITKGILAAEAVNKAISLMSQGIGVAAREFVSFDHAAIGAAARFDDIGPFAKNFSQEVKRIKADIRDVSRGTEYLPAAVAVAVDSFARAGFKSKEAIVGAKSAMDLATASGEDLNSITSHSMDLLGSFGLAVDDSAQKIKNLARLNDVLGMTGNISNVTIEDLFETFKQSAPVAVEFNRSLEEMAAIAAVLGNAGIKGSEGATTLKNALLNLTSAKTLKMVKNLSGVKIEDKFKNLRKPTLILQDLSKALSKMGNVKKTMILEEIFGRYAIAGSAKLIKNLSQISSIEKRLIGSAGINAAISEKIRGLSSENQLKRLAGAAMEIPFKFFDAFEIQGKKGIEGITKALQEFDVAPYVTGIKQYSREFSNLVDTVSRVSPEIEAAGLGLVAFLSIAKGEAIYTAARALWAVVAAQTALNVAMWTNPIVLVAAAFAALVTVSVLFLQNIDKIGPALALAANFWIQKFDNFKNSVVAIFKSILATGKKIFLGLSDFVTKAFDPIVKLLSSIPDILKTIGSGLYTSFSKFPVIGRLFDDGRDADYNYKENYQRDDSTKKNYQREIVPPNKAETEARQIMFNGQLNISGAPKGSTFESRTIGAPPIQLTLLGQNR